MTISEKDVRHVADLARLHVEDEEIGPLVRHFEAILGHFSALSRAREEGRLVLDRVDPFSSPNARPLPFGTISRSGRRWGRMSLPRLLCERTHFS